MIWHSAGPSVGQVAENAVPKGGAGRGAGKSRIIPARYTRVAQLARMVNILSSVFLQAQPKWESLDRSLGGELRTVRRAERKKRSLHRLVYSNFEKRCDIAAILGV